MIGSELESNTKNKNKKNIFYVIFSLIIVFVSIIGYLVWKDLKEEELLINEINSYLELGIAKNEYDLDIKTSGDYGKIERTIKSYFKEISELVKKQEELESDDEFLNILTANNFKNDGPTFVASLKKIHDVRSSVHDNINRLVSMCSEEYIMSLIEEVDVDDYYVDLYKDLMCNEHQLKKIRKTKEEIENTATSFNIFLDDCEAIILFLKENSNSWKIENDSLVFSRQNLLDEYSSLTNKLLVNSKS